MNISVNGEPCQLPGGANLTDLLDDPDDPEQTKGVAIALNGEVVRRADWARVLVREGDTVEIVRAAQGG